MSILVSGGAGYIGSHTCVELIQAGYDIVVADNLVNSSREAIRRVEQIVGRQVPFVEAELCDPEQVEALFQSHPDIRAVIHFAGLKAVGESVEKPLEYYTNNLVNTLVLLNVMRKHGVRDFVFSSSATVYGNPGRVPFREDFPVGGTTNPYGTTKLFIEQILTDLCAADSSLNVALLRYFNPIGAHESGLIGEDPTPDGTGVRDYIHVVDLARGHVSALKKLEERCGLFVCNLGTGKGYSVLEVLRAYEKACGKTLPYVVDPRRPGDIAECYADPERAEREMGWKARYGIEEMCASSWKWQSMNPDGYGR